MVKYALGLDLGPTSVGWAAIELDGDNCPIGFAAIPDGEKQRPALGSRIFEAGVDNIGQGKNEQTKNKPRQEKRSLRRMNRRKRGRKLKLKALLQKNGMLSEIIDELYSLDPYELRDKAVKEQITLEEISRIILHIAQRRGFKSNRKQPEKEGEKGAIKDGIKHLQEEKGSKTVGQYWYQKIRESKGNVPKAIRNKGNYKFMARREDYQKELELIFECQRKYYPDILTNELSDKISEILFDQIRFELSKNKKRKVIGMCSLIPSQRRCSLANRKSQEFRLLQKINDLKIIEGFKPRELKEGERQELYKALMSKKEMTFKQIRKLLKLDENYGFNFEHEGNSKLIGNIIDASFAATKIFGKQWDKVHSEDKQEIWDIFQNEFYTEDSEMTAEELAEYYLKEYKVEVKEPSSLEKITVPISNINYSEKALDKLLPYMREGYNLYDATNKAGFLKKWRCLKKLPIPEKSQGYQCNNPVVKTTLFQVRKIVNALIRELGSKPQYIIIETAREFNAGAEKRQKIVKRQKENQNSRSDAQDRIREHYGWAETVNVSSLEVMKYRLWKQQNEYCPYSCRKIEISELLSRNTEIDHILPFSMSLDNTMGNKVVCFANENQDKRQNTPISWLGEESERFQTIVDAIENERFGTDKRKWERFFVKNEDISENYTPERLLRDTSYIATEVRSFLQKLYPVKSADQKVLTTKGPITAEMRNVWDINAILRDGEVGPKNRDDLRHHAVDAAIVAVSKAGMVKKVTERLREAWPKRPSKVSDIPQPWEGFGKELFEAVMQVNVSHRVQRRVRGKLHKETIYNKEENGPNKGKFVTTVTLNSITAAQVKKICDPTIRQLVEDRLKEFGGKADKAFVEPLYLPANKKKEQEGLRKIEGEVPVKKVRILENSSTMVQIDDNIWCEPGNNHHVEIFKAKVKGKETLIRRVYSLLDVSKRLAGMAGCTDKEQMKRAIISRENPFPDDPTITDVEFMMSLAIGESVIIVIEGNCFLYRVRKMSYGANTPSSIDLFLWRDSLAKFDEKVTKETIDVLRFRNINDLLKFNVQKVMVDPLGRVRWAND